MCSCNVTRGSPSSLYQPRSTETTFGVPYPSVPRGRIAEAFAELAVCFAKSVPNHEFCRVDIDDDALRRMFRFERRPQSRVYIKAARGNVLQLFGALTPFRRRAGEGMRLFPTGRRPLPVGERSQPIKSGRHRSQHEHPGRGRRADHPAIGALGQPPRRRSLVYTYVHQTVAPGRRACPAKATLAAACKDRVYESGKSRGMVRVAGARNGSGLAQDSSSSHRHSLEEMSSLSKLRGPGSPDPDCAYITSWSRRQPRAIRSPPPPRSSLRRSGPHSTKESSGLKTR